VVINSPIISKQLYSLQAIKNKMMNSTNVYEKLTKITRSSRVRKTFPSVSSMASSLNFLLPPFSRMLSKKVARSSTLDLPATPLGPDFLVIG
jgi:hypothetical protein